MHVRTDTGKVKRADRPTQGAENAKSVAVVLTHPSPSPLALLLPSASLVIRISNNWWRRRLRHHCRHAASHRGGSADSSDLLPLAASRQGVRTGGRNWRGNGGCWRNQRRRRRGWLMAIEATVPGLLPVAAETGMQKITAEKCGKAKRRLGSSGFKRKQRSRPGHWVGNHGSVAYHICLMFSSSWTRDSSVRCTSSRMFSSFRKSDMSRSLACKNMQEIDHRQ